LLSFTKRSSPDSDIPENWDFSFPRAITTQNIAFPQVTVDRVRAEQCSATTEKASILVIRKPKTDAAVLDLPPASA